MFQTDASCGGLLLTYNAYGQKHFYEIFIITEFSQKVGRCWLLGLIYKTTLKNSKEKKMKVNLNYHGRLILPWLIRYFPKVEVITSFTYQRLYL